MEDREVRWGLQSENTPCDERDPEEDRNEVAVAVSPVEHEPEDDSSDEQDASDDEHHGGHGSQAESQQNNCDHERHNLQKGEDVVDVSRSSGRRKRGRVDHGSSLVVAVQPRW